MCLDNFLIRSGRKRRSEKELPITAYKVMLLDYSGLLTPFQRVCAVKRKAGYVLQTKRKELTRIRRFMSWSTTKQKQVYTRQLTRGAIHCLKTMEAAEEFVYFHSFSNAKIFKVYGYGYIGENEREIAFHKIVFGADFTAEVRAINVSTSY